MRVLAISGSARRGSHNTGLLQAAARALPSGVELELFDGLLAIPPYCEDADVEPAPEPVERLRERVAAADAVLIATPEYNASIPGALKNAIDWASRPYPDNVFKGKPVLVIGASTGLFGAVWAQADMRKVLRYVGAHVLESELPVGMADAAFALNGALLDPELGGRLESQLQDLLREVEAPIEQA